jgi:hypothetical protein
MSNVGQREKLVGFLAAGCGTFSCVGLGFVYVIAVLDGRVDAVWECSRNCAMYYYLQSMIGATGLKILIATILVSGSVSAVIFGIRLLTGRTRLDAHVKQN